MKDGLVIVSRYLRSNLEHFGLCPMREADAPIFAADTAIKLGVQLSSSIYFSVCGVG